MKANPGANEESIEKLMASVETGGKSVDFEKYKSIMGLHSTGEVWVMVAYERGGYATVTVKPVGGL